MREKIELLEDHTDLGTNGLGRFDIGEFDTFDDDFAMVVLFKRVHTADQRRFARPGRATDDDAFAQRHVKIDVFQRVVFAEPFVQVPNCDHGLGALHVDQTFLSC